MVNEGGRLNARSTVLLILIIFVFFSGCASKRISKTAFKELVYSLDYYEYLETNKTPKGNSFSADLLPCFNVNEPEFKKTINDMAVSCWERELEDAPETIDLNSSEFESIKNSVSVCVYTNLVKELKDDFTFDKSPDRVDYCKKIYEKLKTFK